MSGSASSVGGAEPRPAPAPGSGGAPPRRRSLLKLWLVLAICAAPVVASYVFFYAVRPSGAPSHGTLIQPTRSLPDDLALRTLDGAPVDAASLTGQWLLVVVAPAACGEACERRLFEQRQLREMLGRERGRVDKVWLIPDGGTPAPALRAAVEAAPAVQVLHADAAALARWLAPEPGHRLDEHLYVVDPMGEWMMRMPSALDPSRARRDLERLLRASQSWDRPGRGERAASWMPAFAGMTGRGGVDLGVERTAPASAVGRATSFAPPAAAIPAPLSIIPAQAGIQPAVAS